MCRVRDSSILRPPLPNSIQWSEQNHDRYCFGAPFVCDELAKDVCTAGAFAHPAFLEDRQIRAIKSEATSNSDTLSTLKVLEIASGLITLAEPLLLSCAEIDHTFPAEARRKAVDMLIEDKKSYHLQLFGGVEHGFALRGDQNSPYERRCSFRRLVGQNGLLCRRNLRSCADYSQAGLRSRVSGAWLTGSIFGWASDSS